MKNIFYLTAWSKESPKGGIYSYTLSDEGLKQHGFAPLFMAGYLCFSPDGKTLYATGAQEGAEGVAAYALKDDGEFEYLGFVPSSGVSTCHVCTSPDGKYLYTANYASGSPQAHAPCCPQGLRPCDGSAGGPPPPLCFHHP